MNARIIKYPPGSSWLYLRLYGGPQALDDWLIGPFYRMLGTWLEQGMVARFHYIHYLDPHYHLRLRFFLADPSIAGRLMTEISSSCESMLEEDLAWKIEAGTYEPEYERYGSERMDPVERWFHADSLAWLAENGRLAAAGDTDIWKSAVRSVDVIMNDFGADSDSRLKLMVRMRDSVVTMLGVTRPMRAQLDEKYRRTAVELLSILSEPASENGQQWVVRTAESADCIRRMIDSFPGRESMYESEFIPSLVHMSLNRAFRTRHRMQELIVYDFLVRYYTSLKARSLK
jgi:thiopeptide-type bacteriocin biosynthesis protein